MNPFLAKKFSDGLSQLGLPEVPWDPFQHYLEELLHWNKAINLTSIVDPLAIVERHFLDSLANTLIFIDKIENVPRGTILDIGTGAGFPGIPLKIALPSTHVTLAEPIKKKVDFVKSITRKLFLKDISVLHGVVDKHGPIGSYDLVVSRATFHLAEFIAIASKHVSRHGSIVAMKTQNIEDVEMAEARSVIRDLSLSDFKIYDYTLPFSKIKNRLYLTKMK